MSMDDECRPKLSSVCHSTTINYGTLHSKHTEVTVMNKCVQLNISFF